MLDWERKDKTRKKESEGCIDLLFRHIAHWTSANESFVMNKRGGQPIRVKWGQSGPVFGHWNVPEKRSLAIHVILSSLVLLSRGTESVKNFPTPTLGSPPNSDSDLDPDPGIKLN